MNTFFTFESTVNSYEKLFEREYIEAVFYYLHETVGRRMSEYDFVLFSGGGDRDWLRSLKSTPKPRVLIHISDESSSAPVDLMSSFRAVFKCFLLEEYTDHNIFTLPLGYASEVPDLPELPMGRRKYNVFFSGSANVRRTQFCQMLEDLSKRNSSSLPGKCDKGTTWDMSNAFPLSYIRITTGFGKGLDPRSYARMLQNTKIALCPTGWKSNETYRHFEAMRAGCVIISDSLPRTRLYLEAPIICVDKWDEVAKTVNNLLQNPERLDHLQSVTRAWWEDVCSEKATAEYIAARLWPERDGR